MTPHVYMPRAGTGERFDPDRCAASVFQDRIVRSSQCVNPARYEEQGHGWCGIHRPSFIAERERKFHEKCRTKADAHQHKLAIAASRAAVVDAVLTIHDLAQLPPSVREAVEQLRALEARKP